METSERMRRAAKLADFIEDASQPAVIMTQSRNIFDAAGAIARLMLGEDDFIEANIDEFNRLDKLTV